MSERIEDFASRFEQANEELIATVQGCGDEQWAKQCGSDVRSLGVVADHVAGGYVSIAKWVESIAAGQPLAVSMDAIHAGNAKHAQERVNVTRDEVVDLLRSNGKQAAEIIRSLDADEIERPVPIAIMGGAEKSAADMIGMLLIGHIAGHGDEIRKAMAS